MIRPLDDNQTLAKDQFFKLIRTRSYHMLLIGSLSAIFVENRFARNDEPVANKVEQRRHWLIRSELDCIIVHRLGLDDRASYRSLLLGLRIVDHPVHHRVNNVRGGNRGAVAELVA